MNLKRKRYYVDHDFNRVFFVSSGRKSPIISSPEMEEIIEIVEEVDGTTTVKFKIIEFQETYPFDGWNPRFIDYDFENVTECGLDTPYRWFWSRCVDSDEHFPRYTYLFRMLKHQFN